MIHLLPSPSQLEQTNYIIVRFHQSRDVCPVPCLSATVNGELHTLRSRKHIRSTVHQMPQNQLEFIFAHLAFTEIALG